MEVGDAQEVAEAPAEGGGKEVEVVFDEVGVEGAGGARATEGSEADVVEGGGEGLGVIEEEGGEAAVGDGEEEGLAVALGTEV